MAITIKDITELPTGTPISSSPLIYGDGTNLFTTTLGFILGQVTAGITDLSFSTLATGLNFVEGSGVNPLDSVNITIAAGEIAFLTIEVIDTNSVATLNRYLIPLGEGIYNPLGSTLAFTDLFLIEKKSIGSNPSGSNTVTYVATDLTAINASSPALDLTDSNLIYFIDLDDGFYRFVGTNGLYGSGELTMVEADLIEVAQPIELPQPAIGTPPVGGTFSVALNNFFGTDYSATSTSLTSIDIAGGAVLGGFARIKGNWSTKPTITGATELQGSLFRADTELYLYIQKWNDGVVYYYDLLDVETKTQNITVTSSQTLNTQNQRVIIDASSNHVVIQLPPLGAGQQVTLVGYDATNLITINTDGTEEIRLSKNNVTTTDNLIEGDVLSIADVGTHWQVI